MLREGKKVVYLDIDSHFTASIMRRALLPKNLFLIFPKGEQIDDAFVTLLSWTKPMFDLLVIDSVTTFYHITPLEKFSAKNRKLGFYLALLRDFAKKAAAPVLLTSHQTFRKVGEDWVRKYSGGRVLDYHSSFVILNSIEDELMNLQILKGDGLRGRAFGVPLNQIDSESLQP
jgi:hypothetical protein